MLYILCFKREYADTMCFQLRLKNINVSVRTQKRTKANEKYSIYFRLRLYLRALYFACEVGAKASYQFQD